ncbi:MAG: iron uptake porin, partial [Prochloraceae cyanobacterium]
AAELQALLDALNQSVGIKTAESLTPEELATLQRLQTDFATELNRLNRRAELLETRTTQVEDRQFSPTTTLSGEVIVALSGDFGDNTDGNLALQQRTKLSFRSSFNGKDRLTVSFSGGNFERFSYLGRITNEGRLGFDTNTDNALRVSTLSYRFPLGKNARILVAARGDDVSAVNPIFSDRGTGSISRFGRKNPVYRLVESGGIGFRYRFSDLATLGVGYFSGEREDRNPGDGLFNGDYSTALRLKLNPTDRILLGLLYINTYSDSDLKTGTGSLRSQVDLDRSVVGNSYSLETSFRVSPKFVIGGWAGFTDAIVLGLGDAHVWNYALTFAFLDLGKEGNLLGFIIGQEPRLTGTSGFTIDGRRSDPDISLHIEALYRYQVRNNLSITPGLIWITAPNHDNNNGDIFVVTVRTTFEF